MWQPLHDAWWRLATTTQPRSFTQHLLGGLLQGGACLYQSGVRLRNHAYDAGWVRQTRLPCPVISVGNVTVGGTGKTACVELLATKLQRLGKRVAILSRGYGSRLPQPYWLQQHDGRLLLNGQAEPSRDGVADEPQLLALHLAEVPVVVGSRREQTGRQACEQLRAEALILDDGLQYRRLHRNCEIVLVNGRMPLGGWPLFPRGPMREPLTSLRRADVIIITKVDQSLEVSAALQERLRDINPFAIMATAIHEPVGLSDGATHERLPLEQLEGRRISLLSSIGDPEGFEQTVRRLGATVVSHAAYPDHHRYALDNWQAALRSASHARAEALLTTEKDLMRLHRLVGEGPGGGSLPVWVLRIRMSLLSGEALLDDRLAAVCAR